MAICISGWCPKCGIWTDSWRPEGEGTAICPICGNICVPEQDE